MNYPMQSYGLGGLNTVQNMSDRNMAETLMANGGQRFAGGGISNIQRMADGGVPKYTFDALTGKYTPVSDTISAISSDAAPKYTYDPITQRYTLDTSTEKEKAAPVAGPDYSGSGEIDSNPNWTNLSDVGKAGYFALNPFEGAIAKGAQNIFNSTLIGKAQNALVPGFQDKQAAIYSGMVPSDPGIVSYAAADPGALQGQAAIDAEAQAAVNADTPSPDDEGLARGGIAALAQGGMSNLGDYSDGGRLLRGPGDGVSDSIPATIANKQPARLADGEFVVPARIVSELGNGSTEAGARKLYQMLARVQNARKKSIGQGRVAVNSRADKMLPA